MAQNERSKDPFRVATGLSAGGLLVLFALYGEKFWVQAQAAWLFLLKLTETAPLGLGAFFFAHISATLWILTMRRWLPKIRNNNKRRFAIEATGVMVAVGVSWIQMRGPTATQFDGVLFGILAGLVAPLTATGFFAVSSYFKNRLTEPCDDAADH